MSVCLLTLPLSAGMAYAAGRAYFVSPQGSDTNNGTASATPFKSIQKAIDLAQAGDTITLAAGNYLEDVISKRDGGAGAPITITGPSNAVLKGGGDARIFEINHRYLTLQGFTIDGMAGNANSMDGYRDKLLYVHGTGTRAGVTNLRLLNMTFKNGGGECVRFRYFVQNSEIANSTFTNCGVHDFRFGAGGKNGEAVYIGTAPEQRGDGKNPTSDPDQSNNNWVHHNTFDTQGNECVDIKEAATGNIIEYNTCTGQKDPESAGFDSRGEKNIFRYNTSYGNVGAGVRLGGDTSTDGINNEVYGNTLRDNKAGGIKIQRNPQRTICGNITSGNGLGDTVGSFASNYNATSACSGSSQVVPTVQPTATIYLPTVTAVPTNTPMPVATTTAMPAATSAAVPTATSATVPTATAGSTTNISSCGLYRIDGNVSTAFEAERFSTMSGGFLTVADSSRWGGNVMAISPSAAPRDANTAITFNLNMTNGGNFYVWVLGYGKSGSSDSIFVQADTGKLVQSNLVRGSWGWKKAVDMVSLTDGAHTLRVSNRESGAQVDMLLITKDKSFNPEKNGFNGQPITCS